MKTFIFNILVCCLVNVFAGILVPDGVIKKSILSVISLYLLYVIMSPILTFLKSGAIM